MRALALLALTGCASIETNQVFRWPESLRPVTVLVDESLPLECQRAAAEAITFWQHHVDYLQTMTVSPGTKPFLGEILITWEDLELPDLAVCHREVVGTQVIRATIGLEHCSPQTVTHELGHSLGLDHSSDPTALMYPEALGNWAVTREEVEQIQ